MKNATLEHNHNSILSHLAGLFVHKNNFVLENRKIISQNQTITIRKPQTIPHNNSDFLNSVAHELRTPLSAIVGFCDILKDELKSPESIVECRKHVSEIEAVAVDLIEMVNDLLDVGKIGFEVDMSKEIDVVEVVKKAVRLNYDYALRRGINIRLEVGEDLKLVKLDAKKLKQVVTNLISNAVKYSPRDREIVVSIGVDDEVIIAVKDHGFGMTKAEIKKAFERYKTIANPNSRIVDSFGLGLPIVKELVSLMKGEIEILSEVGRGTEVVLRF